MGQDTGRVGLTRRHFLGVLAGSAAVVTGCARTEPEQAAWDGSVVTRWDTDPWALGSYSALAVGSSWRVRQTLADTVLDGRLVLAGEYTATDFPATVHGALGSGYRAAQLLNATAQGVGRVAVIGAGMAGLGAARRLQDTGWQVEVFEARDRVGGRVWTDYSLGVPAELGAAWIHGVTGNALVRLVKQAGLGLQPTNFDDFSAHVYPSSARAGAEVARADEEIWRAMRAIGNSRPDPADSVAAALAGQGWQPRTPEQHLVELSEVTMEFGVEPDRLGAQALWEGDYYRGGDSLVRGGFAAVPQSLAAGLQVRTGTAVRQVSFGTEMQLETDSGPVTADAVVVAVPLSLLQTGTPRVQLPPAVSAALDGLITGNLEKVFLRYGEVWWPDAQVLQIVSAPDQRWAEWYPLTELTGAPLIFGFSGGRAARERPTADPDCAAEAANALETAFR